MAYTRAWTVTTPADTDQASTLGAVTRNLRTDIQERMDTLLGGGWSSDPVAGYPITKVLYIPPTLGGVLDGVNTQWSIVGLGAGQPAAMGPVTGGTKDWFVPLIVPVGVTLTKIRAAVWCKTGAAGGPLLQASAFLATQITAPAMTQLGVHTTTPTANSTWTYADMAIANYVVAPSDIITVLVQGFNTVAFDVQYGGLEVTYTVPNLLTGY